MIRYASILALLASPLAAQDFSEGSTAREWGLIGESKATFQAKVVDIACELTGQCAPNCGDGKRQMGLLRSVDGALVLVMKNSQPNFKGGARDLALYCNQTVQVDGVLLEDEELGSVNMYMIQKIKPEGAEEFVKTNKGSKLWAAEHPEAKGKGPWFRRDPRVKEIIAEDGYLGLGHEVDKKYAEENY